VLENIFIFIISSIFIWYYCIKLATVVDYIDYHFGIGSGFGGTIILSIVTNLPEIAIITSGTAKGDVSLAFGNLIGGIAMQTLLLVIFDFYNKSNKHPLSSLFDRKIALLQIVILILVLVFTFAGTKLDSRYDVSLGLSILFVWIIGLLFIRKYQTPKLASNNKIIKIQYKNPKQALWELLIISIIVLICGVLLEDSGNKIADKLNINGVIFGATILALITSAPELSSGLQFVRNKSFQPIASDIFGGNSFLPVLLLVPIVFSSGGVFNGHDYLTIHLLILGIVLSLIYMVGIFVVFKRKYFYMGIDSWIVLVVYIFSMFYILKL